MAFNLEARSQTFVPFVKYNAKAGRWYSKTDIGDEFEVANMTAVFDLEHIKSGWLFFTEGMAPDAVWDTDSGIPDQPTPQHKRGFSVNVFSQKELGGVREFSSTSNITIMAVKELYDSYLAADERKKGLVPVVKCTEVTAVKSKFGTNFAPVFQITRWVPRPEPLREVVAAAVSAAARGNGAAAATARPQVSEVVPPPIMMRPAAKPIPVMAEEEEEF
jgi:hypothetical protein